eukprot:tig00021017_g17203.t1
MSQKTADIRSFFGGGAPKKKESSQGSQKDEDDTKKKPTSKAAKKADDEAPKAKGKKASASDDKPKGAKKRLSKVEFIPNDAEEDEEEVKEEKKPAGKKTTPKKAAPASAEKKKRKAKDEEEEEEEEEEEQPKRRRLKKKPAEEDEEEEEKPVPETPLAGAAGARPSAASSSSKAVPETPECKPEPKKVASKYFAAPPPAASSGPSVRADEANFGAMFAGLKKAKKEEAKPEVKPEVTALDSDEEATPAAKAAPAKAATPPAKASPAKAPSAKKEQEAKKKEEKAIVLEDSGDEAAAAKKEAPKPAASARKLPASFGGGAAASPAKKGAATKRGKGAEEDEGDEEEEAASKKKPKAEKQEEKKASPAAKGASEGEGEKEKKKGPPAWKGRKEAVNAPPPMAGQKEIPVGAPNCLAGKAFLFTGLGEALTRTEAEDLVKMYGGTMKNDVSKNLHYIVVGADPGPSKIDKLAKYPTVKRIDEDGFLDLIRNSAPVDDEKAIELQKTGGKATKAKTSPKGKAKGGYLDIGAVASSSSSSAAAASSSKAGSHAYPSSQALLDTKVAESGLWVDKYKPKSLDEVVGNGAGAKRLDTWLASWEHGGPDTIQEEPKGAKGKDKGVEIKGKRAVLISGPPGIGKTTAAALVCRLRGFDVVELNASDARSKGALKDLVQHALRNRSIKGYATEDLDSGRSVQARERLALIFDECDGMTGSDRGGIQELILYIKKAKVPIICICNDRSSKKVKSLANHCADLRFQRPPKDAIARRVQEIARREGLSIDMNAATCIAETCNNDIRQVLNNLQMMRRNRTQVTYMQAKAQSAANAKDIPISPFDVARDLLDANKSQKVKMADMINAHFNDADFVPMLIQENYVNVQRPWAAAGKGDEVAMEFVARAADSCSEGDVMGRAIRQRQQWQLSQAHAVLSTVRPAVFARGGLQQTAWGSGIKFSDWFGKNSSEKRMRRLVKEMSLHSAGRVHAGREALRLDCVPVLRDRLVKPLAREGGEAVPGVVRDLLDLGLTKDDLDAVIELNTLGPRKEDKEDPLWKKVPAPAKAALTREYNKAASFVPQRAKVTRTLERRAVLAEDEEADPEVVDVDSDEEGSDGGAQSGSEEGDGAPDLSKVKGVRVKAGGAAKTSPGKGAAKGAKGGAKGGASSAGKKGKK